MNELNGKYLKIIEFYGFEGKLTEARPHGNGHINDTILITLDTGSSKNKYILQKINRYVFHRPDQLMANMVAVTEHIRKKLIASGSDPEREVLTVIPASNGDTFYVDDGGDYWRVTKFISGATGYDMVRHPEDLYITGLAFGNFQKQLMDFPADTLYETIPGFHDTRARYAGFLKTVEEDKMGRAKNAEKEIRFILDHKELACYSMESFDKGELPLRVTHNDTKLNNLLFDDATGKAVCVLDLDTVMPGLAMNDFGDAIRSGACTALEDERDLRLVHLDLGLYEQYAKGFIEGADGKLTAHEIETFPMGAMGITYENALRFLADYLDGDVYFKTAYPEHNLVRTRTQIRMVEEMEADWDRTQSIIRRFS